MFRLATVLVVIVIGSQILCAEQASISFALDVEPVLAKAGCNTGACHGNQNGKGGFRLSLRGQDPEFDYRAIVDEYGGRRVNMIDPVQSLFLRKATAQVSHRGGERFLADSESYELLRTWVEAGAPRPDDGNPLVSHLVVTPPRHIEFDASEIALQVVAHFVDGTQRDVTRFAVYEPSNLNVHVSADGVVQRDAFGETTVIVRYLNSQLPVSIAFLRRDPAYRWLDSSPTNYVDQHVFSKLRELQLNPAARCEDHVFLRRVFLDVLGILPTAQESRAFVQDMRPGKRDELIDDVLSRPEFADNWAMKWSDLLHVEEKVLDETGVEVFHRWIRDTIASGKGLDAFVADLLVSRGSTYKNPPTNYFRGLREINQRGEAAARVFLGTRLQCAQCHNHPFDRWTQDDYYAWAALFARVDYEILENNRDDGLDKNQFKGEQIVRTKDDGEVTNPTSHVVMHPRYLGADDAIDVESERLVQLARWLTSSDNVQFSKAQVNRLWYHLMGRGLVDPVDDFRVTNPASHPELLDALARDFIECGFDIRHILRTIMRSETYQVGILSDYEVSETATDNYAVANVRRLSAEQLLDAQAAVLGVPVEFNGYPLGVRAGQLPGVHKVRQRAQPPTAGERFLFAFGKPERLLACECERSDATTLSQALLLLSGPCIDELLKHDRNVFRRLARSGVPIQAQIEELYWSAVSRPPTEAELSASHSLIGRSDQGVLGAFEDIAWALLNAKEFVFRQ